jgi:hypothetical protein
MQTLNEQVACTNEHRAMVEPALLIKETSYYIVPVRTMQLQIRARGKGATCTRVWIMRLQIIPVGLTGYSHEHRQHLGALVSI